MRSTTGRRPVTLTGERVIVRTPRPGDQAALERLRADPEIDHFMGVEPGGGGFLWRQVFVSDASGSLLDLVVADRADSPIGLISFWDRSIPHQAAELSIWIGGGHRNGGNGTEALRLALRHVFAALGLHKVYLRVLEYNSRAIRAYEKCGFRVEGRLREEMKVQGRWHDLVYMGVLDREFAAIDAAWRATGLE